MKLNIEPKEIELRERVAPRFSALSYTVEYDNEQPNGPGLPPGRCVIKFTPLATGTAGQSVSLPPIVIAAQDYQNLAQWSDEDIEKVICERMGVKKVAQA